MKTGNVLTVAAIIFGFGCSNSDRASTDSAATAKSEATLDPEAAAAAERAAASASTATPGATTPAGEAAAAAAARGSTPPPPRSGAATSGTAASAAAAQPVASAVKPGPVAGEEVAVAPAKPEVKAAPAAAAPAATAAASAVDPSTGKLPYDVNCRKCHGVLGTPPKAMQTKFPKLLNFDAGFFARRSDDSVVKVLTTGASKDMPSFKDKLSVNEMRAVAAYIRTFGRPR